MQNILFKAFTALSGVCSIFGFIALFFGDKNKFFIAVAVYAVAITAFFVALFILVYRSLALRYAKLYRKIATMQTFTCDDSVNAVFETRRLIQSKIPFLDKVECKSKWLGKGTPVFKVNDVPMNYTVSGDPDKYDVETIKLDKILAYNETMSYKVSFGCSFSDYEPRFGCKVEEPTDFIQFRILLGYKTGRVKAAELYKRSIKPGSVSTDIFIENVDFDHKHKLYFKIIDKPEIGYNYFIKWDK